MICCFANDLTPVPFPMREGDGGWVKNIMPNKTAVIALGGNAIGATGKEDIHQQFANTRQAVAGFLELIKEGYNLAITHGNGPVVGKILLRQYYAREHVPPMRLDVCVAHSQGGIGHLLMQGLEDELARAESARRVACLITRVVVDADDEAFSNPTKPIGPFFSVSARAFSQSASDMNPAQRRSRSARSTWKCSPTTRLRSPCTEPAASRNRSRKPAWCACTTRRPGSTRSAIS